LQCVKASTCVYIVQVINIALDSCARDKVSLIGCYTNAEAAIQQARAETKKHDEFDTDEFEYTLDVIENTIDCIYNA
jgi:hypothetical protein